MTLLIWASFLALAVLTAAVVGTHVPGMVDPVTVDPHEDGAREEIHRSRVARLKVALIFGLGAPALLTAALRHRHRRQGVHARGISIELTETELRLWGRGYGSRVPFAKAEMDERLVDVYAGRLGAWRQVRLRLRAKARHLELAAPAREDDTRKGLPLEGGEGDCVELERADYEALKAEIVRRRSADAGPPNTNAPAIG